jgi:hypothetical protein
MKKSFSVIVIAALLLAGCSKSELTDREPSGALIQAKSAFPGVSGEATRVPYIGDVSSSNPLEARVLTSRTKDDYTSTYANGKMTFGSGAVGYDVKDIDGEPSFAPSDEDPYYLMGLYPYGDWSSIFSTTATRSLDGKTDVMAAAQQETTYEATITNNNPPTLPFKHLLTKLEVKVKGAEAASAGKWGEINKIELAAINAAAVANNVTITLADGSAASTAFSGTQSDYPFYGIGSDGTYTEAVFSDAGINLTTTAALVAYSLIPPYENTDANIELTFNITTRKDNNARIVEVPVKLPIAGYTQGLAYSITFTFDAIERPILSKAAVTEWIPGGSAEAPVLN